MPRIQQRIESDHSRGRASREPVSDEVDILGIGFGPTNLGLAIAIEERSRDTDGEKALTSRFVEAKPKFGWHDGMLLPNVTMQISFLKDLVSLRTPTSPYTFVNYLHERQRLSDFINLKTFFPSRREFHDYASKAAPVATFSTSMPARLFSSAIKRQTHFPCEWLIDPDTLLGQTGAPWSPMGIGALP